MWYPILSVVNLVFSIGKYAINGLSASGPDGTIFKNKTGDLSDAYYVEITPAGWTFSIWGFIYTWEALWIVYSLVNICRRGPNGPAYTEPMFIPTSLFVLYCIGSCLNMAWLLTFDRQEIEASFAVLVAYSFLFYGMLALTYVALDKASPRLADQKRTSEIWLTRGLLHNALAMQATWVSVATLLNAAMVMTYRADPSISVTNAATVSLSILSAEILVFAATDLLLLDRYSRYTITPYIVLVVALTGSIDRNYKEGARNSTFSVVLLAVAGTLLLTKLVLTIYRHVKGRRYRTNYDSTIGGSKSGVLA
ncbi:uncharacterized protein LOC101851743 [Aplysia californica]|uniref:Uncharacterized protein LOC101851743 n=1 Tax=Aplysia californica TaxID=6500 RepID=A0ABM0JTZ8_APLCA|nr:uncharacterized protein LOC101851743 [Aplysia californica]